jgi:hypothetical protein
MCGVGIMVSFGLWALRVPMAGTVGFLAALLSFIPNLGPVLSIIPPILLTFTISPRRAVLVVFLFGVVARDRRALDDTHRGARGRAFAACPHAFSATFARAIGWSNRSSPRCSDHIVFMVLVKTVYREKLLNN